MSEQHQNIENILHPVEEKKLQKDFYVKLRNSPDTNEKIDYIYATLKRQQRWKYIRMALRILLILAVGYFIIYLPPETK